MLQYSRTHHQACQKKEPKPQLANIITSINKSKKINPSNRTVTGKLARESAGPRDDRGGGGGEAQRE